MIFGTDGTPCDTFQHRMKAAAFFTKSKSKSLQEHFEENESTF